MASQSPETPPVLRPRAGRPRIAVAGAVAFALAVGVSDLFTGSAVGVGFLGLAPLLCAALGGSPRQTAWVTALVVALAVALGPTADIFGDLVHIALVLGGLFTGVVAVYIAKLGEQAGRAGATLRAAEARRSALLEAAIDSVITIDHRGRIVELNPAAAETFGLEREAAIGREMAELIVPPDLRESHRRSLAHRVETGEGSFLDRRIELRGMRADSSEFPIELTITRIEDADPPMFTGFVRDISDRVTAERERERLLESERLARLDADGAGEQLTAILRGVTDAVTAQGTDGCLVFANDSAVKMFGFPSLEALLAAPVAEIRDLFEAYDEDGEPFADDRLPGQLALQGESTEAVIRYVDTRDASERWSRVKATPIRGDDGAVAMAINVIEDVTELVRAEQSQRLLAEVSQVLSSSLATENVLQRLTGLATAPWLASWCAIHTLDGEGGHELAAWASADEQRGQALTEINERFPPDPHAPEGVANVIRTGLSELYPETTPELIAHRAAGEEHRDLIMETGPHSAAIAPITSRGRVLGAITFVRFGSGRRYDDVDVDMAEDLGRRVGAWLDTANLYAERSYIARVLQESLLPAQLPEIPGVVVAARFRASGAGNEVGGDFYDLFQATGGSWSVIVGDVCGKGPDAAAVTALARYTLRAAAMREPRPSAGLLELNEALLQQRRDLRFATVAYASLVPENGGIRVDVASAGHPLPIMLRSDGTVEPVGSAGTLVGVVPDPTLQDTSTRLDPGDALVFYTDGVTEARNETGIFGEAGLESLLRSCAGMDADRIASSVEEAAVERQKGETRDDIAVVVVQAPTNVGGVGGSG